MTLTDAGLVWGHRKRPKRAAGRLSASLLGAEPPAEGTVRPLPGTELILTLRVLPCYRYICYRQYITSI